MKGVYPTSQMAGRLDQPATPTGQPLRMARPHGCRRGHPALLGCPVSSAPASVPLPLTRLPSSLPPWTWSVSPGFLRLSRTGGGRGR